MSIERLIVAALACWRITSLLLKESGPFNVLVHWRTVIGRVPGLAALATCVWCLSLWVAIPVTLIALTDWWLALIPLALSAATIGFEERAHV